jgi:hypothetical protein
MPAAAASSGGASGSAAGAVAQAAWEADKQRLMLQASQLTVLAKRNEALKKEATDATARATALDARAVAADAQVQCLQGARDEDKAAAMRELQGALDEARAMSARYSAWVGSAAKGVRMECRPESADDFFERLDTFRPSAWHAFSELGEICPVECAMHGWFNVGVNALKSTEGAVVRFDSMLLVRGGARAHRAEVARVREAIIATGHQMLSAWIGASCPATFRSLGIRRLSGEAIRTNAGLLRRCSISGMLPAAAVDEAAALAVRHWSAVQLPATKRPILTCGWCRASCPLPAGEDGESSGHCIGSPDGEVEHHGFCPMTSPGAWKAHVAELHR